MLLLQPFKNAKRHIQKQPPEMLVAAFAYPIIFIRFNHYPTKTVSRNRNEKINE